MSKKMLDIRWENLESLRKLRDPKYPEGASNNFSKRPRGWIITLVKIKNQFADANHYGHIRTLW